MKALSEKTGIAAAKAEGVTLTHPDRVLFPEQGATKAVLAAWYAAAGDRMLRFAEDHPLSLVRCPAGRTGQCFFQKHDTGGFPDALKSMLIAEKDGERKSYYYLDGLGGLFAGVQMGVLEFHIWGSRRDRLEQPDRIVFDIDPGEGMRFADVKTAAVDIRAALDEIGLNSLPLVTGGKGIHVVVPLTRRAEWEAVSGFAEGFAKRIASLDPSRFIAVSTKAKRKGVMFLDYLRNSRGATAIAPYSIRARAGAPIAMPVTWKELGRINAANEFTFDRALPRLKRKDPWADYEKLRKVLSRDLVREFA